MTANFEMQAGSTTPFYDLFHAWNRQNPATYCFNLWILKSINKIIVL